MSHSGRLAAVPLSRAEATAFVERWHRHRSGRIAGHKYAIGAHIDGEIVGVVICGRPVSRRLDDGWSIEVLRLATDGSRNACSFLYGRAVRAAFALGYHRVLTYTLESEPGTSLRAAGFREVHRTLAQHWSRETRPRVDLYPKQHKIRWEKTDAPSQTELEETSETEHRSDLRDGGDR